MELEVIGNELCTHYEIIQNIETMLFKGDVLELLGTENYNSFAITWDLQFQNVKTKETFILQNTLEGVYFQCLPQKWEPDITRHLTVIGNNINYNPNYKFVHEAELSTTLMVPGMETWLISFVLGGIATFYMIYLSYQNPYVLTNMFNFEDEFRFFKRILTWHNKLFYIYCHLFLYHQQSLLSGYRYPYLTQRKHTNVI